MRGSHGESFSLTHIEKPGDESPEKPITLLWLIGQYYLFGKTEFSFAEAEPLVGSIIKDYTGNPNIIDPFWRLSNDGILDFPEAERIGKNRSGGVSVVHMRQYGMASFSRTFLKHISHRDNLMNYCEGILENYFPESCEEDILYRAGLDYRISFGQDGEKKKRRRDPRFRESVAVAYNHQCAVCGFNLMLGGSSIANEAAHIKWHAYDGPDTVSNGLLLCNLHHNLFDRGVFTFTDLPRKDEWVPDLGYVRWHRENVYMA